jgi:hypothetical protein
MDEILEENKFYVIGFVPTEVVRLKMMFGSSNWTVPK